MQAGLLSFRALSSHRRWYRRGTAPAASGEILGCSPFWNTRTSDIITVFHDQGDFLSQNQKETAPNENTRAAGCARWLSGDGAGDNAPSCCLGSLPAPALLMGLLGLSLVVLPDLSSLVILSHTSGSCLCTLVRALLSKTVATCGYWTLDMWLVQTEVFCK